MTARTAVEILGDPSFANGLKNWLDHKHIKRAASHINFSTDALSKHKLMKLINEKPHYFLADKASGNTKEQIADKLHKKLSSHVLRY